MLELLSFIHSPIPSIFCPCSSLTNDVSSTLAVSNIRNRTYTNCEVYLIDYGYGDFKEKIHFME
ncbi:hypothetical protein FDF36_04515 [Bacteroides fragilis]|nr:hypothetical protein [Bacteroides fragilis]